MISTIPMPIVYAGLAGCIIALIVATAQQNWQCRVFFLLALRLAIGWHFLFEGLHKINSHIIGPSETNKPFTSEPYFRASPTYLGEMLQKQFHDPELTIQSYLRTDPEYYSFALAAIHSAKGAELVKFCPHPAREELASLIDAVASTLPDSPTRQQQAVDRIQQAQIRYTRWVYGLDSRPAKLKFVTGDLTLSVPQRLAHIENLDNQIREAEDRRDAGLGKSNGVELKRVAELRNERYAAQSDLARDAKAFLAELKKDLTGKDWPNEVIQSRGEQIDQITMWFIAVVGACILIGLFTRLACLFAAGFLIVTYLIHPPFPWYPLPPNTEGNPIFINKNVIECLALLVLACYPTGRWLGLDALLSCAWCGRKSCRST